MTTTTNANTTDPQPTLHNLTWSRARTGSLWAELGHIPKAIVAYIAPLPFGQHPVFASRNETAWGLGASTNSASLSPTRPNRPG